VSAQRVRKLSNVITVITSVSQVTRLKPFSFMQCLRRLQPRMLLAGRAILQRPRGTSSSSSSSTKFLWAAHDGPTAAASASECFNTTRRHFQAGLRAAAATAGAAQSNAPHTFMFTSESVTEVSWCCQRGIAGEHMHSLARLRQIISHLLPAAGVAVRSATTCTLCQAG